MDYKTTSAPFWPDDIPDPVAPEKDVLGAGQRWELVGAAASPTRLFWFWKRVR